MNYSNRFLRISQLLFTSEVSEEDTAIATKIVDMLEKIENDLQSWSDTVENNLGVFNNYHGKEKALVVISDQFENTKQKQKEKYERIIDLIKKSIELIDKVQDVEMQDMITNLTKVSEEYTEKYNALTDLPFKIGEAGFIQEFKDASQTLIDGIEPFFDVVNRIKDYIMKHMLGEQALS